MNELEKNGGKNLKPVKMSILLVTYNQEKYIRKTLDSIFSQIFDGAAEIVVADDASKDRTVEIIKEYVGKDERFNFKFLATDINHGITKNYERGFKACQSEYIAILEGDDYWVSPYKLQKQTTFLDEHLECDLCSVNYFVYEENRSQFYPRVEATGGHRLVTARNLIADNLVGNFSTCMYRKSAIDQLPADLFDMKSYDWIINICVARQSLIGFLNEPMSVYRLHSSGAWSQASYMQQLEQQLKMVPSYDELTNHVFQKEFLALSDQIRVRLKQHRIHILSEEAKAANAESGSQIIESAKSPVPIFSLANVVDCLPPFILSLARATVPPLLKRFIVQKFINK